MSLSEPIHSTDQLDLTVTGPLVRALIVAATVVSVGAVGIAHRSAPITAVLLCGVVVAYGILSVIDAAEQRLPNRITLPLAGASAFVVAVGGFVRSDIGAGFGAIGMGLATAAVLFLLRFGMGDVKLALTVGTVAGWLGVNTLVTTLLAMAVSGAVVAVALIAIYRRRDISFSYGPFLAIGSIVGMLSAGSF